ncbi:DUF2231 domain-containing protein [Nocardioides sp. P5_C9_2]
MFDLVNGIPVHPLVVHAIVVLLPLATLGTIAIALRPRWRRPYGPLVVGSALVATVLCPVATSSGESLEERVGSPGEHAELGDTLVWFALALLILSALLVYLQRRNDAADGAPAGRAIQVVAVLAVIAALASTVQVYRVGDSGARSAWGDSVSSSSSSSGD